LDGVGEIAIGEIDFVIANVVSRRVIKPGWVSQGEMNDGDSEPFENKFRISRNFCVGFPSRTFENGDETELGGLIVLLTLHARELLGPLLSNPSHAF
jgi:hypothetical protein